MATKYNHYRVTPEEFQRLMRKSGMKLNDFLYVSGRSMIQVQAFLTGDKRASYTPTMGDVMLLEMSARDPGALDAMTDIANGYSLGKVKMVRG